jgi:hypothetical protein
MPNHTEQPDPLHAADMCLLLRAHCEQRWLDSELVPVLDELEHLDALPHEQLGAALAYLEVLSLDARMRASDTDAAAANLDAAIHHGERFLLDKARRYYAAVRRQRHAVAQRVEEQLLSRPCDEVFCERATPHQHASF